MRSTQIHVTQTNVKHIKMKTLVIGHLWNFQRQSHLLECTILHAFTKWTEWYM